MEKDIKKAVEGFGFKIKKSFPFRSLYLIDTGRGIYCLKKTRYKLSELLFIHGAKEYLAQNGFANTDRYVNRGKKPYIKYKNDYYVMTKWISGRKCNYKNPVEIDGAAQTLARFHMASKGYIPPVGSKLRTDLGQWQKILLKRCEDLIYMKNLVKMKSTKKDIDILFLKNVDSVYNMAIESVKMLQKNGYFQMVQREGEERYLCHNNYTYPNIIIDENNEYNIINFEHCKCQLRSLDLFNFIMANIRKLCWDYDLVMGIMESYNKVRNIEDIEFKIMASLFQFPHDFWRTCSRYYFESYKWSEEKCYGSLKEAVDNMPLKFDFLEKYSKEL